MSVRRWTPLFFVPTPVLRFVLGDVWWWVPCALWLGGLVGIIAFFVSGGGGVSTVIWLAGIVVVWSLLGRVFLRLARDAWCVRLALPGVVGWWCEAILGWISPRGPAWTLFLHDDGRDPLCPSHPLIARLRLWRGPGGAVSGTFERHWRTRDGGTGCEVCELDPAIATEVARAAEDYARVGFPKGPSHPAGMGLTPKPNHLVMFRRGSRPRLRASGSWDPPESGWLWTWWGQGVVEQCPPLVIDLRNGQECVQTGAGRSFSLGDSERDVREAVGGLWGMSREVTEAGSELYWSDRGLCVEFDSCGHATAFEVAFPAYAVVLFAGDSAAGIDFLGSGRTVLESALQIAAEQGVELEIGSHPHVDPAGGISRDVGTASMRLGGRRIAFEFDDVLPVDADGQLQLPPYQHGTEECLPDPDSITVSRCRSVP